MPYKVNILSYKCHIYTIYVPYMPLAYGSARVTQIKNYGFIRCGTWCRCIPIW